MSDPEIVVKLTADQAQLQAGMEQGAASVKSSTEQMQAAIAQEAAAFNAAVQAKIDAQVRLNAAFAGGITSTEGMAEAETALDGAMNLGAISAAQYTSYVSMLDAAEAALTVSTTEATVATEANTAAQINSRTAYSMSALVTDALTGQFSRSRREVAALANETGVMSRAFQFAMSPAGLIAIAIAAVAAAAISAKDAIDKLATSAAAGGGMAGMSRDQLEAMAQGFKEYGYSVVTVRGAMDALSASGKIAADSMHSAMQASLDLAQLTGTDAEKIAAQLSHLGSEGENGILRMDQQYHFLNDSQRDHIDQLFKEGQATEAVKAAFDALAAKEHESVETLKQDQGDVEGFWSRMGTHIGNAFDTARKSVGMGLTNSEQVAHLDKVIAYEKQIGGQGEYVNGLLAQRSALLTKISAEEKAAVDAGSAAKHGADQDEQVLHKTGGAKKGKDDTGTLAADDRQLFQEMQLNRTMSLESERAYWQAKRDAATAGTKEYQQAVQQLLEIKNKEASQDKEAANKEATQARETARKKIEADKEAAQEHISMEREVTQEMQKAAKLQQQLSLETLKASHDAATQEINNKRQAYQNEYIEGQITAQQLLQLEDNLVAQKLALDAKYYQAKAKLDAGDVVAVTKDNAAIVSAKLSAQHQMQTNEQQFIKNSEKQWATYAKKIEGSMQSAVTGMIFQHQKLRTSLANIGMVIAEDFIQNVVMKPLNSFIEGEAQKIAKSTATQTTMQAQQAADSAAESVRSLASVTRAAGVAGAMGTASFAGAPWPVDMGAPAFGAGMAAAALAYGSVASASGGWERVPADGMMTELHKNEMVLPAATADHVRNSMGGKGGGGGGQVHIHANDARSFKDMLRRNPGALAGALRHAGRMGH
jgi:hypothetical protein